MADKGKRIDLSRCTSQPALPLDTTESDLPGLRAAYQQCNGLHRHYSFEQALSVPALRMGLKNMAEAMARRRPRPVFHQHSQAIAEASREGRA